MKRVYRTSSLSAY